MRLVIFLEEASLEGAVSILFQLTVSFTCGLYLVHIQNGKGIYIT